MKNDEKFAGQERAIDVLAKKALEHDARFNKLEEKTDNLTAQVLQGQDEILTILKDLQEEIPAIAHAVTRHDKKITRIEEVLHIN